MKLKKKLYISLKLLNIYIVCAFLSIFILFLKKIFKIKLLISDTFFEGLFSYYRP